MFFIGNSKEIMRFLLFLSKKWLSLHTEIVCIIWIKDKIWTRIQNQSFIFDIDGTLVSFQTHRIPQSTVEALEKAKQNGVKIYISTGRPIILITNLGQIEHLIDGYITTNGARCFVENHTVCQCPILRSDVEKVIEAADRDDYSVIVVGEKHLAIHHLTPVVEKYLWKD